MWKDDIFTICASCNHLAQEHHTGDMSVPCKAFDGIKKCGCDFFIDDSKISHR